VSDIRERSFDDVFDGFDGARPAEPAGDHAVADADGPAGPSGPLPPSPRRRLTSGWPRWVKVVAVLVTAAVIVGIGFEVAVAQWKNSLDKNIERIGDPFQAIPQTERATVDPVAGDALNILLLGSDSRISAGNPQDWVSGAQRTDAIMVLHLSADRKSASVVSLPRDSWVTVPGHGKNKINAAFSLGGPSLMIRTVESVTGVRIDHVVVMDFTGFKDVTDALGGVKICVPKTVSDRIGTVKAGCQVMNGETALQYVRQRKTLSGGDFDRVRRQQNWIRQVLKKLASGNTLTNPGKLNSALDALTSSTATDDAFTIDDMYDLALDYQGIDVSDVAFFTAPLASPSTGYEGSQSVVYLDDAQNALLWKAYREDKVNAYIAEYTPRVLGADSVR
jgi:LCP family protein required for cell wall assembly